MEQQSSQTELFNKQVEEFVKAFPDVKAEEIPNEVWKDVADGIPLAYAYSYRMTVKGDAEKSNEENDKKSIPSQAKDRSLYLTQRKMWKPCRLQKLKAISKALSIP